MKHTPFSINGLHAHRSNESKEESTRKHETAPDNSPEMLRESMRNAREHHATIGAGPTVTEMLKPQSEGKGYEHASIFKQYLESHGVKIENLGEGDLDKVGELRVKFLERVQYAEQVREMVNPELIQNLINSGFLNENHGFKKIVDSVGSDALIDIVRKRMVSMAVEQGDRFENLSKSLELAMMFTQGEGFQKIEQDAAKIFKKFKLDPESYKKLREIVNDPDLPEEEREKMLRKKVRESKGFLGLFQGGIDKSEVHMSQKYEKLSEEEENLSKTLAVMQDDLVELERQWRESGEFSFHNPDDNNAQQLTKNLERQYTLLKQAVKKNQERFGKIQKEKDRISQLQPLLETMTSRGGAEKLAQQFNVFSATSLVSQMEDLHQQFDGHMREITDVVQATLDTDPVIRKEMGKAMLGTRHEAEDLIRSYDRSGDFVQADTLFQRGFDQFVAEQRHEGNEDSREDLQNVYRKKAAKRAQYEYNRHQKRSLFDLVSSLFSARRAGKVAQERPLH